MTPDFILGTLFGLFCGTVAYCFIEAVEYHRAIRDLRVLERKREALESADRKEEES